MDYNNIDLLLTEKVKGKINKMKNQKGDDTAFQLGSLLGTITLGIVKLVVLAGIVWLGWQCCVSAFQFAPASFLQISGILAGVRSLTMFLIDPYLKEDKK
jgi:hypothetical protein